MCPTVCCSLMFRVTEQEWSGSCRGYLGRRWQSLGLGAWSFLRSQLGL